MADERTTSTESLGVTSRETVTLPDSVEGQQAEQLWNDLGFSDDEPGEEQQAQDTGPRPPEPREEGDDILPSMDPPPEDEDTVEDEGEPEPDHPELADAPEFWSEEDRKHWLTAPPELREVVKRHEKEHITWVNEKVKSAVEGSRQAQDSAKQLLDLVQNSATWWQQNGAKLQQGMEGKWANVNWQDLVENNPAEFQRLRYLKEQDDRLVAQAREQGERDQQITRYREQAELGQAKQASHDVLARELPEHFGPTKYETTYKRLGEFLSKQGIPAERINGIHEAPIIRMALESMLYREARARTSGVVTAQRDTKTGQFTAKTAPTRLRPGPGTPRGNRQVEQDRQAMEQLRKSRGNDIAAATRIFRNNFL